MSRSLSVLLAADESVTTSIFEEVISFDIFDLSIDCPSVTTINIYSQLDPSKLKTTQRYIEADGLAQRRVVELLWLAPEEVAVTGDALSCGIANLAGRQSSEGDAGVDSTVVV